MKLTLLISFLIVLLFPTADAPGANQEVRQVRFAVIGDFGTGDDHERTVANLIDSWDVDFIVTTGDNYYLAARGFGGNGFNQYDNSVGKFYCAYLKDVSMPNWGEPDCPQERQSKTRNRFFPSIGNHDRTDTQGQGVSTYLHYFTLPGEGFHSSSDDERYYDFVQGPIHFFIIDSDTARRDQNDMVAQQSWLHEQLQASSSKWQFVFFHQPAFSSSVHGSDAVMQWPFARWGADAVFQGHDHVYERILRDGIVYIVSGNGGKDLYEFGTAVAGSAVRFDTGYGAVLVTATDETIDFEAWAVNDEPQDTLFSTPILVDLYHLPRLQQKCAAVDKSQTPDIRGEIWVDNDEDGHHDSDEHLHAGFPVNLWNPGVDGEIGGGDDHLIASTRSGNNGYGFCDVAPGPYFVEFEISDRFAFTTPVAEDEMRQNGDSDAGRSFSEVFTYDGNPRHEIDAGVVPNPAPIEAPLLTPWSAIQNMYVPWILIFIWSVTLIAIGAYALWKRFTAGRSRS